MVPCDTVPCLVIGGKAPKKRGERREEKERKKGKEKKGFSSQDSTRRTRGLVPLGKPGHQTTCLKSDTC
jgi:hypothetical protein